MATMREVELVEDDEPPAGDPPDPAPAAAASARRRSRRVPPRTVLLVSALACVTLVGAQQGVAAYQRHVDNRYAGVRGALSRLRPPLRTLWHADGQPLLGFWPSGDRLVGTATVDGVVRAEALDLRTGGQAWAAALPGASDDVGQCDPVTPGSATTPTRAVCLTWESAAAGDAPAHLAVLDARTGRQLAAYATPRAEAWAANGDVVVLVAGRDDGATDVRAADLLTGSTIWTATTTASQPDVNAQGVAFAYVAAGEAVVVDRAGVVSRFALADGSPISGGQLALGVQLASDGSRARLSLRSDDGTTSTTTVVNGPGQDLTLPGFGVTVSVDDGSLSDLVLTDEAQLGAYDARTGTLHWTAPVSVLGEALILDHVVYARTTDGIVAIDGRTGFVRWRSAAGSDSGSLMTDGFHLFVEDGADPAGHAQLVALDKGTGHVAWRSALPAQFSPFVFPIGSAILDFKGDSTLRIG
jgi:hypothetical protein